MFSSTFLTFLPIFCSSQFYRYEETIAGHHATQNPLSLGVVWCDQWGTSETEQKNSWKTSCFLLLCGCDNPSSGTVPSLHIQFYACSVPSRLLRCLTLLELKIPQGHYLILNTLLVPLNQFSSFKSPQRNILDCAPLLPAVSPGSICSEVRDLSLWSQERLISYILKHQVPNMSIPAFFFLCRSWVWYSIEVRKHYVTNMTSFF